LFEEFYQLVFECFHRILQKTAALYGALTWAASRIVPFSKA
jgi:hypothetical protein